MKSLLVDLRQDQPILRIFNTCCEYCRPSNIYTFRCWRLSVKYNGGYLLMIFCITQHVTRKFIGSVFNELIKKPQPPKRPGEYIELKSWGLKTTYIE